MVLKQKNPYWTAKAKEDLKEITKYYNANLVFCCTVIIASPNNRRFVS